MKRLTAILLLLLCLSGCGGNSRRLMLPSGSALESTAPTEEAVETEPLPSEEIPTFPQEETDPIVKLYQELVNDLRISISYRLSSDFNAGQVESRCLSRLSGTMQQIFNQSDDDRRTMDMVICELPMSQYQKQEADFGYIIHDINADGVPELFWVREDHSIAAIFTREQDKMVLLDGYGGRYRGYVSENNTLYSHGSNSAVDQECTVYAVSGGKLKELFQFGREDGAPFEAVGEEHLTIPAQRMTDLNRYFPDGISSFWRNMEIHPLDREVLLSDVDGSATEKPSAKNQQIPFLQKIRRIDQGLYSGPGYAYSWLGNMAENGTYTILAEIPDEEGELWGKLKSGNGWVNLTDIRQEGSNIPIVSATVADNRLLKTGNYERYVVDSDEYTQQVAICAHQEIRNVEFYSMDVTEDYEADQLLFSAAKVKSGHFLLVEISFPGDMTTFGVRFTDKNGESYSYLLLESGYANYDNGGFDMWEEDF